MTNSNSETDTMICPVCGKGFNDIHAFAGHLSQHSRDEKKRKEEEEKQRRADQKKLDTAKLDVLKNAYLDAYKEYLRAKDKYEKTYGREGIDYNYTIDDLADIVKSLNLGWDRWL